MENSADQNRANDYKVVSFHNSESFDFTHEMGCMYDGRPITGQEGALGIAAGETKMLPYHVGFQIAKNLAKQALISRANSRPLKDELGNPMPLQAIWDDVALENLQRSYITEMYSEDRPAAQSQTDILFERIAKLEALVKAGDDKVQAPSDYHGTAVPLVAGAAGVGTIVGELIMSDDP